MPSVTRYVKLYITERIKYRSHCYLDGSTKSVWNVEVGTKSSCLSANSQLHKTI